MAPPSSGLFLTYPLYSGQSINAYLDEPFTLGPFNLLAVGYSNGTVLVGIIEDVDKTLSMSFPTSSLAITFITPNTFSFNLTPTAAGNFVLKVFVINDADGSVSQTLPIKVSITRSTSPTVQSVLPNVPKYTLNNARLPHNDPVFELVSNRATFDLAGIFGDVQTRPTWPPVDNDPRIVSPGKYTFDIGFSGNVPENLVGRQLTFDLAYAIFPQMDGLERYWIDLRDRCKSDGGQFNMYQDAKTGNQEFGSNFPNATSSNIQSCAELLKLKGKLLSRELYRIVDDNQVVRYPFNGNEGYYFNDEVITVSNIREAARKSISKSFPDTSPISYIEFQPTMDLKTGKQNAGLPSIVAPGFRLNVVGQVFPQNDLGLSLKVNQVSSALGFSSAKDQTGSFFSAEKMVIGCNTSYSPNPVNQPAAGIYYTARYLDSSLNPPSYINDNITASIQTSMDTSVAPLDTGTRSAQTRISAIAKPNECSPGIMGRATMAISDLVDLLNSPNCNLSLFKANADLLPVFFFSANGALGGVINTSNAGRKSDLDSSYLSAQLTASISINSNSASFNNCFGLNFTKLSATNTTTTCADGTVPIAKFYASLLATDSLNRWGYSYKYSTSAFVPAYKNITVVSQTNNIRAIATNTIMSGVAIKDANYEQVSSIELIVKTNAHEDTAISLNLPANQYRIRIDNMSSRIDGYYRADIRVLYHYNSKAIVKSLLSEGSFKSLADAANRYKNKYVEFMHDGGDVKLWIPSKNPKNSSGKIDITIERADSFKDKVIILTAVDLKKLDLSKSTKIENEIGDIFLVIDAVKATGVSGTLIAMPSIDGKTVMLPSVSSFRFMMKDFYLGQVGVYWLIL
jgi:hypothetical protein